MNTWNIIDKDKGFYIEDENGFIIANVNLLPVYTPSKEELSVKNGAFLKEIILGANSVLNRQGWREIKAPIERKVFVTNNINGKLNNGDMSHVWVVDSVYFHDGEYCGFSGYNKVESLSHYSEIPIHKD